MPQPSTFDLQAVLDGVVESAARLLGSFDARIELVDGDAHFSAAHYGELAGVQPITVNTVRYGNIHEWAWAVAADELRIGIAEIHHRRFAALIAENHCVVRRYSGIISA